MAFTTNTQSTTARMLNRTSAFQDYGTPNSLVNSDSTTCTNAGVKKPASKVWRYTVNRSTNQSVSSNVGSVADTQLKKRWLCNVSEGVRLSKSVKNGLNITCRGKLSQYELMVKLLKAETCDVIYFDCALSASQIGILKMLQVFSSTELIHARLAMQFDRALG